MTYGTLISSVTVGAGGASSIDFTSIPQTYTDLILVLSLRGTYNGTNEYPYLRFNGSSASIYSRRALLGNYNGTTASNTATNSNTGDTSTMTAATNTANVFSSAAIYIPNYSGSNNKTYSSDWAVESNLSNTGGDNGIIAGIWASTAAITSISLAPYSNGFAQYSTAYLYGLTKGSGGATVS